MKKFKVLVACGAGIATSTIVSERVRNLLNENGIDALRHFFSFAAW